MAESERKKLKSEYGAWISMKQRCNNPNCKAYRIYGGRGIKICNGWRTFDGFIKDMGKKPSPKHSLDRIDVNGDYTPNNCRWATQLQQVLNRRDMPNPNGFRGIRKKYNTYQARITVDYKEIYLGNFRTLEEAIAARKEAEKKYARA